MFGTIILIAGLITLGVAIIGVIINLIAMTKASGIEGAFFGYIMFVFSMWLGRLGLFTTLVGAIIYAIQHIK